MDLAGHAVLITGAAKRLGRAFAETLAERGAAVVVHYARSEQEARVLVGDLQRRGARAAALSADFEEPQQAADLLSRAVDAVGEIDWLIHNASIFEPVGFLETTAETWRRHIDVNLTAPFLLTQAFARHRAGRAGAVVNLLDWRALRPGVDHFAYTIAKAGLAAMTQCLARVLAPAIRVNGLALGAILPPPGEDEPSATLIRNVPAGRWGTVEETARAMLFLLAEATYMTGEIVHVDGGRHVV